MRTIYEEVKYYRGIKTVKKASEDTKKIEESKIPNAPETNKPT